MAIRLTLTRHDQNKVVDVSVGLVAIAVAVSWYFLDPQRAFVITLSVLVVTCPCALALATPAAFAAAGARLSVLHLLVTDGNAIEVLSNATTVIFDKTGTLTRGAPTITSVDVLDTAYTEREVREIAAALESASSHPIAQAFTIDTALAETSDLRVSIGQGVSGVVDGRRWRLGRAEFVCAGAGRRSEESTRVYLGSGGQLVAAFSLEDELRHDAAETVDALRGLGLEIMLLSGDAEIPVARVADALDIEQYESDCSPARKLQAIEYAQSSGKIVVMVGDGINDAPVLAGANTSVALAHGAMLAQTSADIIMPGESLRPLVVGIRTARMAMRIVRQNLAWAIVYNATALPLAAAGFVPPWAAAIGMSASSLVVVLNALRLSRFGNQDTS